MNLSVLHYKNHTIGQKLSNIILPREFHNIQTILLILQFLSQISLRNITDFLFIFCSCRSFCLFVILIACFYNFFTFVN